MKGKEGSGDPEGREAKSGLASSGRGLDTSCEKGFFADDGRQGCFVACVRTEPSIGKGLLTHRRNQIWRMGTGRTGRTGRRVQARRVRMQHECI